MPEIIKLLKDNNDIELLENIFKYFEEVSNSDNEDLLEIFSITVLEILGNDKDILKKAKYYMGTKTTKLQQEADIALGRNI